MGKPRDQFGFLEGSKKSQAAALYVKYPQTTNDLKYELGSSFINLLYEVAAQGHVIERGHRGGFSTDSGKNNTTYAILINSDVPYGGGRGIDWDILDIAKLKTMDFTPKHMNDLLTIWLIPVFLYRCLPKGLEVFHKSRGTKQVLGKENEWGHPFEIDKYQNIDHLPWGILARPKKES